MNCLLRRSSAYIRKVTFIEIKLLDLSVIYEQMVLKSAWLTCVILTDQGFKNMLEMWALTRRKRHTPTERRRWCWVLSRWNNQTLNTKHQPNRSSWYQRVWRRTLKTRVNNHLNHHSDSDPEDSLFSSLVVLMLFTEVKPSAGQHLRRDPAADALQLIYARKKSCQSFKPSSSVVKKWL